MQSALVALLLSGLGQDGLKAAATLGVAIVLAFAFTVSSLGVFLGLAVPGETVASARPEDIPPEQQAAFQAAATRCGMRWEVLAAAARVNADFGLADPNAPSDALPALAQALCERGAAQAPRPALLAAAPGPWYADQVLAVALRYGYLAPGETAEQVTTLARAQMGRPYVWGGASPATSFDCSGLVQWVHRQVGISLPRTAQQQYRTTARLTPSELRPSDLVFFANTYPTSPSEPITHVGIYIGNGRMVNAPSEGDVIREQSVFSGFWGAHYAGAGRVER